ncbi:hypothetical protein ACLB2K_052068 [Fragaria x ananassa]
MLEQLSLFKDHIKLTLSEVVKRVEFCFQRDNCVIECPLPKIVFCRISPGIAELVNKLKANGTTVYLVSGGFRQMIYAHQPGGADLFICYAGVQHREAVAAKADWLVFNFEELLSALD